MKPKLYLMHSVNLTKYKFFFLLLCQLLITNVFAQKTNLQRDNLKGNVRSVSFYTNSKLIKTRTYNLNGFETGVKNYCPSNISSICSYDTSMFDPKGNIVKYVDDNFIIEKKYDDAGNLIESIQLNKDSKKISNKANYNYVNLKKIKSEQTKYSFNSDIVEFNIVINYSYDPNGNLVEEDNAYTSHGNTKKQQTIYKYDESQNLIEKTENNSDGKMQYNYIYKYDSVKRKIEYQARSFNGSGYTNYNEYFKYDEKGHLLESSQYELTGKLLYKDVYNFDNSGNQIKRSHYYGDILTMETVDVFNDLGLLTAELEYKSKTLVLKKTFKYDTTGNIVTALYTDESGAVKTKLDYKVSYY